MLTRISGLLRADFGRDIFRVPKYEIPKSIRSKTMPRLVVQPGTAQAWDIPLKPGINFIGRGISNDVRLEDLSVSGSHCQITVENGTVTIKDMGSTNGTFVNRAKIQESQLVNGQPLRLGSVEMVFLGDGEPAPQAVAAQAPPPPPVVAAPPAALKPAGLKVSGLSHAPASAPAATEDAPPIAPPPMIGDTTMLYGARYCKFHPKSPASYLCNKCNRTFCDLCVTSRNIGAKVVKTCRSCGVECVPIRFERPPAKSFYAGIPGAFVYPFKGAGIIILICATVAFSAMNYTGILIKIALYGFVFLFMQNILHTTTSDEEEPLGFPDPSSLGGAALQLGGTIVASFWLSIALVVARYYDMPIPVEAIIASVILGAFYFPMALLSVAMKDSVMAGNPLIVIPAMMKAPVQYLVTALLMLSVFGVRRLGGMISGGAGTISMTTKDMSVLFISFGVQMLWALMSVYLLTVTMRILGLFYNSSKDKLGWFSH